MIHMSHDSPEAQAAPSLWRRLFSTWHRWRRERGKPRIAIRATSFDLSLGRADGVRLTVRGLSPRAVREEWMRFVASFAALPQPTGPGEFRSPGLLLPGLNGGPVDLYTLVRETGTPEKGVFSLLITIDFGDGNLLDDKLEPGSLPVLEDLLQQFAGRLEDWGK